MGARPDTMHAVPLSRNLALAAAFAFVAACGGPAVAPSPALVEGEGRVRLRFNRPPTLSGNPDLFFELTGPAGWERISLENPDDEQDLLAVLVAEAEANPSAVFQVEGAIRPDTRAYADHTARVLRLLAVPSAAPTAPASDVPTPPAPSSTGP